MSNVQTMKGKLATSIIKLFNTEPVSALFDTGVTCSCISASLYDQISQNVAMIEKHLKVGQADGTSLGPRGLVKLLIEINKHFKHLFIVCQNLKQPQLFGIDFSQCYKIEIDWDHTGASYLWYKGRKLMSASCNSALPQCVTGITNHITDMDTMPNRLGTRLVTTMTRTTPPHHMAVIPITSSSHPICSMNITTEPIEVIQNPLPYIKQLYLCVLDSLHRFYDRYQNKCIALAVNVSDEELRIVKAIAICFLCAANVTEIHHNTELSESINRENDVNIEMNESAINKVVPKETLTLIPLNSSFMFNKDFYPKPRITLLDEELSNESKQQWNDLLEVFSDIISKDSMDISLTHLEEMVLPTEPGAAPVASKPYDLPLKHHKFVKEELMNLVVAGLIERSLSPYAAPIIVVPHKAPPGSSLTKTKRLVIDYCEFNKQLSKVQTAQAKSKGSIALIETAKIDHTGAKLKGTKFFSSLNIR